MNNRQSEPNPDPKTIGNDRQSRVKRFVRRENPGRIHLTNRDLEVLESIGRYRFLSGEQLERLVFDCSASRVRRRMRALYDHKLVERIAPAARPVRGLPPLVYVLTRPGLQVLKDAGMESGARAGASVSTQSMRHDLWVNDVRIAFAVAARKSSCRIVRWLDEQALKLRTPDGRGRVERIEHPLLDGPSPFLPDAYFELEQAPGRSYAFFVEVDLATHAQRIWRHRAKLYRAYADPATGYYKRRFGRETFRLLVVTTPDYLDRSRGGNILRSIRESIGPSDAFLTTSIEDIHPDRVLSAIWRQPQRQAPVAILPGAARQSSVRVATGQVDSRSVQSPGGVLRVRPNNHQQPPDER